MTGFLRRFLAPAEDPRRAFPDPVESLDDVRAELGRVREAQERLATLALELRRRRAELEGRARRALAAGDREGAREIVSLHELAVAELEAVTAQLAELEAAMQQLTLDEERLSAELGRGGGSPDPFAVELRFASLEWELEQTRASSRQPSPDG